MDAIYLDANASTPLDPEVLEAMLPYLREHFGNATSGHARGRILRDAVERAREQVATLLGCESDEIVFTSGGSESNNLAIKGAAQAYKAHGTHLVISAVEHPSVTNAALSREKIGWTVSQAGVDPDGRVAPDRLRRLLTRETSLVSVMLAQNETGVLQPVDAIARLAHEFGVPVVHCDAAQAVGKIPVKVRDLEVDLLTLAAHKFHGPWGVGALYVRRGVRLEPLVHGAGHERGLRAGTPNVAAIVGLGKAAELAEKRAAIEADRLRDLRDRLWQRLQQAGGAVLHGHPEARLPNTLNVAFEGVHGAELVARVPEVHFSTGSACHAGSRELSGVLAAMGVSPRMGLGAIRLSLCRTTTPEEVDRAGDRLVEAVRELRAEARQATLI